MSGVDIAVIVSVAVLFSAALAYVIYRKIKGKGSCDCSDCGGNCADCGGRRTHAAKSGTGESDCCSHCSKSGAKIE